MCGERGSTGSPRSALFVVVPDVPFDAAGTLELWRSWAPQLAADGWPLALALQDGMGPGDVPWDELAAVFVGGSTSWKMSPAAHRLVDAALERGRWAHMGRVNTLRRLRVAASWGCQSSDGTTLGHGARVNLPPLLRWLEQLRTPQLAFPPA